jgi:colicin import membrane protein
MFRPIQLDKTRSADFKAEMAVAEETVLAVQFDEDPNHYPALWLGIKDRKHVYVARIDANNVADVDSRCEAKAKVRYLRDDVVEDLFADLKIKKDGKITKAANRKKGAQAKKEADDLAKAAQAKKEADDLAKAAQAKKEADDLANAAQAKKEADDLAKAAQAKKEADDLANAAQAKKEADDLAKAAQAKKEADDLAKAAQAKKEADDLAKAAQAKKEADEDEEAPEEFRCDGFDK